MGNNTFKHISDKAVYETFDPTGTQFPPTVKNVQDALALTSPTTQATETAAGTLKIATDADITAGTDDTKAVTPLKLKNAMIRPDASTSVKGILFLATNAEALTGTNTTKAIVPSSLKYVIDQTFTTRVATETQNGVIKIANSTAASAGTDDTMAMTPLKVKQAIAAATSQIPSYTAATESQPGLVTLATAGQMTSGTARSGVAVSPFALAQLKGSLTVRGIVQAATLAQANLGDDDTLYISAKGFKTYNATTANYGTVKLTDTPGTAGAGVALSSNAAVLRLNGTSQVVTGTVNFTGTVQYNSQNIASEKYVQDSIPIGTVQMWMGTSAPTGGLWALCDGGAESKAARPELFAVLGYRFGGSGDVFYRPDMRGLFVRGAGVGKDILAATGTDEFGKPMLGNNAFGGAVGEVQAQQIRRHQHVTPFGEAYTGGSRWPWGRTTLAGKFGSNGGQDWDNFYPFTNPGDEIEDANIRTPYTTLNSKDLIGGESRPWNMSVNYIIKVR